MSGLFLLAVVGLWVWLAFRISKVVSSWVTQGRWRWPVVVLLYVVLLPLPVADEIVGGFQFRALCAQDAVLTINAEKVKGRTVKRIGTRSDPGNTLLHMRRVQYRLIDFTTGEELGSYATLSVDGGAFIRALGISEGNAPLLINPSDCDPRTGVRLDRAYEFTLIDN